VTPRSTNRIAGPSKSNGLIYVNGEWIRPEYAYLAGVVTKDDEPVDGLFAERQQRLLASTPHESWKGPGRGRPFVSMSNVGVFIDPKKPPLAPDSLLAVDVAPPPGNLWEKQNHSYFIWLKGKPPDVVTEIVSEHPGGEDGHKLRTYARWAIPYYVIFDPQQFLHNGVLRIHRLRDGVYELMKSGWFPEVGLGLKLWKGAYEGSTDTWLRWCDARGRVIPTGAERAEREKRKKLTARRRADQQQRRADQQQRRAEAAEAKLRALGIDPEE
jgi:hypothetical protein